MRKLSFLLPLLFVLACSKPASESAAALDGSASPSSDAAAEEVGTPGDQPAVSEGESAIFAGEIEYIPFVMHLTLADGHATGQYFYTKQGKPISVTGDLDPGEGTYALQEQVNGKTTGHFSVLITEEAMSGTWRAKLGQGEVLNVSAQRLNVPYEPNGAIGKRINGRYTTTHTTQDMSTEDSPEEEVTDLMAVRYIGGGYFSFYLSVVGANYHTGEVSGLAKMTDDTHAKTDKEDCALRFSFRENSVDITEDDCGYYHGARASFDVALARE